VVPPITSVIAQAARHPHPQQQQQQQQQQRLATARDLASVMAFAGIFNAITPSTH